jgi:hypothetical protein
VRATASKVGLLAFCQWWATPEAEWTWTTSDAADRGTRFHKAIANYTETRKRAEVDEDLREEYAQACDWVDSLGSHDDVVKVERAFAWDLMTDTAEEIGSDRDYRKAAGRLCGTVDLILLARIDGKYVAAMVWDWKTGSGENSGPQLRALGLMVARAYGLENVTVAALEVRASGVTEVAREELDEFALSAVAGELAEQIASIPNAEPKPGSHCGDLYCPARLSCPLGQAAIANVSEVIPADVLVRRQDFRITDPVETAEQAIMTVDVLRLMSAWIDAKKDEIKSKVPATGWAAPDGRILKETKAKVEAFDKAQAIALCKELGATDEQLGRCYYTFEKSNGLRVSGGGTSKRLKRAS